MKHIISESDGIVNCDRVQNYIWERRTWFNSKPNTYTLCAYHSGDADNPLSTDLITYVSENEKTDKELEFRITDAVAQFIHGAAVMLDLRPWKVRKYGSDYLQKFTETLDSYDISKGLTYTSKEDAKAMADTESESGESSCPF